MNIQQAFNQILTTGTIAAGIYAHSPAGQTAAQKRTLKKEEEALQKQYKVESEEAKYASSETQTKVNKKFANRMATLKAEQYKIDPSEAAYESYLSSVDIARQYKSNFKDRLSFLTGEERKAILKAKAKEKAIQQGMEVK